jgi:two-component system, OmpR family, sensor kinase
VRLGPRSLRARVTLLFTIGAAAALGLCLALLYLALDRQLTAALDADLRSRGADLVAAVQAGDDGVVARDPLAQLYAADGAVLAGSPSLGDRRLLAADEVRGLPPATIETRTISPGAGAAPTDVRLLALPVDKGRVLTVGVSARPLQDARQRLLLVLLVAAPLLLAALGTGGWLIVRAALRLVDVLSREAAEICSNPTAGCPPSPATTRSPGWRTPSTACSIGCGWRSSANGASSTTPATSCAARSPCCAVSSSWRFMHPGIRPRWSARCGPPSARPSVSPGSPMTCSFSPASAQGRWSCGGDPVDLFDLAATESHRLASALGLQVRIAGNPVVVRGDADRLRQMIANLLHNSAAAGASTVRVHIAPDRAFATLEVADDGPGFPAALLDSAFQRFVRGDRARTRRSGAGLGLSIVRAIVVAHRGSVGARNGAPLGGAVVTAQLPQG